MLGLTYANQDAKHALPDGAKQSKALDSPEKTYERERCKQLSTARKGDLALQDLQYALYLDLQAVHTYNTEPRNLTCEK